MAYSRSLKTVFSREGILRPLLDLPEEHTWHSTLDEAPKLAAQIRECFHIAKLKPADLPRLVLIAREYIIHVQFTKVIARRRGLEASSGLFGGHREENHPRPDVRQHPASEAVSRPSHTGTIHRPSSLAELFQMFISAQPSTEPFIFAVNLTPDEAVSLGLFCSRLEPAWTSRWDDVGGWYILEPEGNSQ